MPTGLYSGRTVDEIDRDTVWAFAEGFGYAFERTVLLERMRRQHAEVRTALATAEQAAQALQDADLELRKVEPAVRSPATRRLATTMTARVNEMLTRRGSRCWA